MALTIWAVMTLVAGLPLILVSLVRTPHAAIEKAAFLWARLTLWSAGARLRVEGPPIDPASPRFYMANHQSALDIPILLYVLRGRARFFSKRSLFLIPVFGLILARLGTIAVDKKSPRNTYASVQKFMKRFAGRPVSVSVYPEGTRTRDGTLSLFRKGTMRVAIQAGLPVVPVVIDGAYRVNHRDSWAMKPGEIRVKPLDPIPAEVVRAMDPTALQLRVVSAIAADLGVPAADGLSGKAPQRLAG